MRLPTILIPFCLAAAAVPALAADTSDLLTVQEATALNPRVPTYVEKLQEFIQQRGFACASVSHINAFPDGVGLRAPVACDGGTKRYEVVFDNESFNVTAAN